MISLSRTRKVDMLEQLPLFDGLGRRNLDLIAKHADRTRLDAGDVLARQGGLAREFDVIVEGSARVEKDGKTIAHLGAGDFFGEVSLIDGKPHTATVIADTPIAIVALEGRSFSYVLDTVPEVQRRLLGTLCDRLREAEAAGLGWTARPGHWPAAHPPKSAAATSLP